MLEGRKLLGQVALVPVQFWVVSHTPAETWQTTLAAWYTSTQVLLVPVQCSAASLSHAPLWELPVQCVVLDAKAFTGQVGFTPSQNSATSHWPAEARHCVPA